MIAGKRSFISKVVTGSSICRPRELERDLRWCFGPVEPLTKMTARKSGSRLETEIERCRSESQWDKIPELVRQLSAKLISNGRKRSGFPSRSLVQPVRPSACSESSALPDSGSRGSELCPRVQPVSQQRSRESLVLPRLLRALWCRHAEVF